MVQVPAASLHARPFWAEAERQSSRILVAVALAELLVVRGARAIPGLRLSEESRFLSWLSGICSSAAPALRSSLLAACVLQIVTFGAVAAGGTVVARAHLLIAGLGTIAAFAWSQGMENMRDPAIGASTAALLLVLVLAGFRARSLLPGPAGVLAATAWLYLPEPAVPSAVGVERIAEALILIASAAAALPLLLRNPRAGRLLLPAAAIALLPALIIVAAPDAARHTIGHLLEVDRAGLPFSVTAALLVMAIAGFAVLFRSGDAARRAAAGILLLLVAGRAFGPEHAALRLAASFHFAAAIQRGERSLSLN